MDSNNELKEIDIKSRMCYYFDDIIKIEDFDINNILVYNISYKGLIDFKPLRIRLDEIDGFFRVYDGTRYLVLIGIKKYDYIYNRFRYLISVKSNITDIISHNYAKIEVDSYNSLPLEKIMTFHNVTILIK